MFKPQHTGIYFTDEHIQQAQKNRESEPYLSAWARLRDMPESDRLTTAQLNALRYRFESDDDAGEKTVDLLRGGDINIGEDTIYIEAVAVTLALAQCFEMARDHLSFPHASQAAWLEAFTTRVEQLNHPAYDLLHFEHLWLNLLNLVAGIVLEQEERFQKAVEIYKAAIQHDVHPEGYIHKAVDAQDGHGLYRMLLSTQALILTAEAASHAGENLWAYEYRGVSAMTPTPYLLYYYYYPDKWRWDAPLEKEAAQALYKRHAGFWEMAQRQKPSRDRKILLTELRPIYDIWGGGLTTLTHGGTGEIKRRGLFG
jgi:Alginate lyase